MDLTPDYTRLVAELERQELQSIGGMASPQVYGQLLAIYLLINDLFVHSFNYLIINLFI
jgi:COP9 signalosome complex subunit 8